MKKIASLILVAILSIGLFGSVAHSTKVNATQVEQCNNVTEYEKQNDFSDSKVNINFSPEVANFYHTEISISAGSGYQVINVWLDVENDGHNGYYLYATGPLNNYNPVGGRIFWAKVQVKKACPSTTPTSTVTPTAIPSPSVIPTVTPAPTPIQEPECDGECVTPTPTPEVTPTPEEKHVDNGGGPSFAPSSTLPPVCSNGDTVKLPANAHVWRNGSEATTNFFLTEGDSANIYWRVVGQSEWIGSSAAEYPEGVKPNGDNFVSYTSKGLNPELGYEFGIEQKTGCGGGKLVVVDGPEAKLFTESYWLFN